MEEDDDDLYEPGDAVPAQTQNGTTQQASDAQDGEEVEEVEVEVEDDDDDFNIITEAPPDAPAPEVALPRHASLRSEPPRPSSVDSAAIPKAPTPSITPKVETPSPAISAVKPAVPQKPGSAYPPIHASNIDVHANPIHPATGKPITSTDIDADFPGEDDKPWRRPGTDLTDYFNYGFDEFTWASYCLKQQELRKEVGDQRKQLEDMQAFLMGGIPGLPGAPPGAPGPQPGPAPPGMPGLPGMPEMSPDMMQGMLAGMMSQGLDPASMDPMSFMQHAQAMMGGSQPGAAGGQPGPGGFGGQSQPQGFGGQGGGQQQMGYGGYDQRGGFGGGRGRGGGGRRW
ncbi:hypothetical protein DTO164E3_6921 [Paecilomyces variotii]|nr:hypothetical protein DTO164E3_6921 [Paecilomyces variotii]